MVRKSSSVSRKVQHESLRWKGSKGGSGTNGQRRRYSETFVTENQLRESIHKWLSPPDPSTNHNIACDTHHKKTATWFFEGSIYQEWKSKSSLLWVHGKRASFPKFASDTVPSERLDIVAGSGKSILWFVGHHLYQT